MQQSNANVHPVFQQLLGAMSGDLIRAAVDGQRARASGNHLSASNDEAEPVQHWSIEIDELRRTFRAVSDAHLGGHEACEMCDFCQPVATLGDLSAIDTRCLLGVKGESPKLCPALGAA